MTRFACRHDARASVIRLKVSFDKEDVRLQETPVGVRIDLPDCQPSGPPGAPALPKRLLRVALPEGAWPKPLRIQEEKAIDLVRIPTLVAPLQPLRPGIASGPEDPEIRFEPFPPPPFTPPDPTLYELATRDPRPAVVVAVDELGRVPVVTVEIRPVRYTEKGLLELVTRVTVEIPYSPRPEARASVDELRDLLRRWGVPRIDPEQLRPLPEPVVTSRAQAKRYADLARGLVLNPDLVKPVGDIVFDLALPADYLIITDNHSWDPDSITPTGPLPGDLIAHFERLAAHKRSRGLTAKVVTVTDIVDGRYGDFRTGARDLQEVIRRFLKDVHQRWGVAWVLLGGDVAVIPARYVAGGLDGHMDVATTDPPAANQSFWTGTHLKMHAASPGILWPGTGPHQLVNDATGTLIPYDATGGTAPLGWYWTAADYSTVSATPTDHVRVNGPASIVNARLQWLYDANRIPTDLYYSSLRDWATFGDTSDWLVSGQIYVFFPDHDWDALDNGLYGQFVLGANVDAVHWHADVSVGRAPVQTEAEAETFVDKVIAYETFSGAGQPGWLRRLLIVASNWDESYRIGPTSTNPPEAHRFWTGTDHTLIHLPPVVPWFDYQLIAEISSTDRRELPYNPTGSPTTRGWHYAQSATDHTPNTATVVIGMDTYQLALPSNWIVVHGPADELDPVWYWLDPARVDDSMHDQEQLRLQLAGDLTWWDNITRLYEDLTDLSPDAQNATPLDYLTTKRMRDALNAAPHIVSLSGHGTANGCCRANVGTAGILSNGLPGFIAYADSCLTGAMDTDDSFAEALLTNPNGGAVAYVGSTRYSWLYLGDDIQRAFFKQLTATAHLGLLNDSRLYAMNFVLPGWEGHARWIAWSLTLFGDPEMSVWRAPPEPLPVKIQWPEKDLGKPIIIVLPDPVRPDRRLGGEARRPGYVVHVAQGAFERTVRAGAGETVRLDVSDAVPGELTVTVTSLADTASIPFRQTLAAHGN